MRRRAAGPRETYLATTENIARYTDGRLAPTALATKARALDEEPFPPAVPITSDDVNRRLGERVGLLLHEEDLEPESLLAEHPSLASTIRASAVTANPGRRSPAAVSPVVSAFTAGAVADAASRANDASGSPATVLDSTDSAAVIRWAVAEGLDSIVVPNAPVDPVQERLGALRAPLDAESIGLVTVRRRWDSRAWPFASRGFFPFHKRIPGLGRQR